MVTEGPPGGDCTFTGCVPSKTLLAAGSLSFPEAIARVHDTVAHIAAEEDESVLTREGVEVIRGRAVVLGPERIKVDGRTLSAAKLVIATGTVPKLPALPGLDSVGYLTNESVFDLTELPRHLVILGGGPIGCEMATAFRRLGGEVTVLELADRLLSKDEPESSRVLLEVLRKAGVDVRLGADLRSVVGAPDGIRVETGGGVVTGSHLLVATGRKPVTDAFASLGLALTASGAVKVDARMRTSVKGIYAAGDVTGLSAFTHAADEMGRVAEANALGRFPARFSTKAIPWVTFTDPEVARVGLSETQAAARVKGARVVEMPMSEVDRARTVGRTEGFVKIVVGPHPLLRNGLGGRVLGATIVAERAGDMLAELVLAVRTGMIAGRIAQASHAYPTWSVAVQQTMGQLFGVGSRSPRPAQLEAG